MDKRLRKINDVFPVMELQLRFFNSVKLKSSQATYPTSNAKSLACDTANEYALTCT